ncbi:LPS-assembly protein LptD [Alistipes sp. OttesenSCG-928-L06]|nr:LPS-assembly protein LptD [Alistipes sp. OttesenSCG-928-L06]
MPVFNRKYNWAAGLLLLFFVQGFLWGGCGRMNFPGRAKTGAGTENPAASGAAGAGDSLRRGTSGTGTGADSTVRRQDPSADSARLDVPADSLTGADSLMLPDSLPLDSLGLPLDSLMLDSLAADSTRFDSLGRRDYGKQYLDDVISGKNTDSVVYDVRAGLIHIYKEAEVSYQDKVLKNADYMTMSMEEKMIHAYGLPDSAGMPTRPIFTDAGKEYTMDSINYNLNSGKAKIRGVWTTEGDGILRGQVIKKMPDNTINIAHGIYSTCDADHPHFYIEMTKAKAIPGKKAVFGYSYLVMEDVPLYFLGLPFGFFPLNSERSSGFIIPSFGEEGTKGFYLRDGGYYFAPNDYIDLTLLGGVYTLGSWEAKLNTRYRVRYKFNGGFNFQYSSNKFGDRGSEDYQDSRTFQLQWSHSQDPKFKPGSTFSASVNFSSTQNSRYSPQSINDYATNQTNSTVSYQKSWAGTPFSMGLSLTHSQVNRDSTYSFSFPNLSFNMSRVNPFKFKNRKPGPERWYEKISLSYSASGGSQVSNVKEYDLMKQAMFDKMNTQMSHNIPVSASFTLFNYINISPSFNYRENWNTRKVTQEWDDSIGPNGAIRRDSVNGFFRTYDYSGSISASTTLYGMYDNFGPRSKLVALRHTLTPNVSASYHPGFGGSGHGFWFPYQSNADGDTQWYSPYSHMSAPGRDASASMNFSLSQTLEAKVRSDKDSTGVRKISIIDQLSFSFSYNFMADSMKLSRSVPVQLRSTLIKGFNINLSTSLGLYEVDRNGVAYDKLLWSNGKAPRVETLSTSFNWSKSFGKGAPDARNSGTNMAEQQNMMNNYDPFDPMGMTEDPALLQMRQQNEAANLNAYRNLLSSQYYDFSVPLNVNFGYSINYQNNGAKKTITQTLQFGASVNLTPKWGLSMSSSYDFQARKLAKTTNFILTRDLHCWQMNFNWSPLMNSWNFHISVKANVLRDLKYEKSGSRFDDMLYRRTR